MSLTLVIASLVIPVAVLLVDYGRRRLTAMRILLPFLAATIVVPFVMPGLDLAGRGLLLEAAGIGAGALLSLMAGAAMRVERDPGTSALMTVAGAPYSPSGSRSRSPGCCSPTRRSTRPGSPGHWAASSSPTASARPRWPTRLRSWAS